MKTLILIAAFAVSSFASADSDKVCDDLYKLTCAPGAYDDGTGIARTTTDDQEKAIVSKISATANAKFRDAFKNPDSTYLRQQILSATGLSEAPQCDGAEENPSDKCLDDMAEGATTLAVKALHGQLPPVSPDQAKKGALPDAYFFMSSDAFKDVATSMMNEAQTAFQSSEQQKKIENDVFPKVKALLRQRVEQMVSDEGVKKSLLLKIDAIKFSGQNCEASNGKNIIANALVSNAFYDQYTNKFKYCQAFNRVSSSEFTLAYVIAHELSHSIDPCDISIGPSDYVYHYKPNLTVQQADKEYPVAHVLSCLRRDDSIHAEHNQSIWNAAAMQLNPTGTGYNGMGSYDGTGPYGGTYYNGTYYTGQGMTVPPVDNDKFGTYCEHDQINESFADWMAMEIVPDYMTQNHPNLTKTQMRIGYSNMYRIDCDSPVVAGEVHPMTDRRANALALVQPKIRAQMGCDKPPLNYKYCPPEGRTSPPQITPASSTDDGSEMVVPTGAPRKSEVSK